MKLYTKNLNFSLSLTATIVGGFVGCSDGWLFHGGCLLQDKNYDDIVCTNKIDDDDPDKVVAI